MKLKRTILAILLWVSFAPYTAGTFFADFQGRYPTIAVQDRRRDLGNAWAFGVLGGPIGAFVSFFLSGFNEYGWRLK